MNVYIYGGNDRLRATKSVIQGNQEALKGSIYAINQDQGLLIVAYP